MAAGLVVLASLLAAIWLVADEGGAQLAHSARAVDVPGGGVGPRVMLLERAEGRQVPAAGESPRLALAAAPNEPAPRWFPSGDRPPPSAATIEALLDDLRDDDVRWNAERAVGRLFQLIDDDPPDGPVTLALMQALRSQDLQQRYYAAILLMKSRLPEQPDDLLDVAVDMMCEGRIDGAPWGIRELRRNLHSPQDSAIRYLTDHAEEAQSRLLGLLGRHQDEEARFLGAFVLAHAGLAEHTDRVAPVLISHLVDNDIGGDAVMAMNALMKLDADRVIWWLQSGTQPDEQFQRSKRLLLVALRNDGVVPDAVAAEDNVVTSRALNPLKGWWFRGYGGTH
jgi:hypothetical protein